jgi:hypothetical protein
MSVNFNFFEQNKNVTLIKLKLEKYIVNTGYISKMAFMFVVDAYMVMMCVGVWSTLMIYDMISNMISNMDMVCKKIEM